MIKILTELDHPEIPPRHLLTPTEKRGASPSYDYAPGAYKIEPMLESHPHSMAVGARGIQELSLTHDIDA